MTLVGALNVPVILLTNKLDNTCTDINQSSNNNGEMKGELDNCIDDKVCVYETKISRGLIYEEQCDIDNKQGSTYNYISMKNENIDDQTVVAPESVHYTDDKVCANYPAINKGYIQQEPCNMKSEQEGRIQNYVNIKDKNLDDLTAVIQEIELMTNCAGNKVCMNKIISDGKYIKQEPCSMKDEQESIYNYVNIKDENIDDLTIVAYQTEFMTDCIDDKVCVNETVISGGYIKQERCDKIDESGKIHDYINIKDENTDEDMFIVVQETELTANPKVNYLICCEECDEKYDLYCVKCPMLFRIFNSNNPDGKDNTVRWALPKHFIDICETPSGIGAVALRAIPKGVVFGPFDGLDSTKDDVISKWKLKNKALVLTKDPEWLNWMQYIRRADYSSHANLTPFQYDDGLYYRSNCFINMGDELLVHWDIEESGIGHMEDGYWEPPVCENLDHLYACTLCCVGYKSINHLIAHNCVCPEKRNKKDLCKEIVQCSICKIYLDKKEYTDYHIDLCCNSKKKSVLKMRYRSSHGPSLCYGVDTKQINCEDDDIRLFACQKKEVHALGDEICSCCKCQSRFQYASSKHIVRVHDSRKLKRRNGDRPFGCILCPYKATTKSNLRKHIAIHNRDKPFACTLCPYKATTNSKLKLHTAIHNGDRPFACTLCTFKAKRKTDLKQHFANHNDDKPFACTLCTFKATTNSNLKQHMVTHDDDRPFACILCPYKAKRKSILKQHIAIHNDNRSFACTFCPYKATTNWKLKQHILTHNEDRPFACTLCPYKATTNWKLKQHILTHNEDRPFACSLCPYKSTTKSILKKHITIHKDDKPFMCTLCPYKTKTKNTLRQHIAVHNNDRPFACMLCPYKAKRKPDLTEHIAIHNSDKPFACTLCPYKATTNSNLKKHIAIHNGDKPFACTLCPYKATRKSTLKKHIAAHNGNKPFMCTLCPYKATTNWKLKQHIATHNEGRSFACIFCPYRATTKSNLKKHITIHNGERPFACTLCSYKAKRKADLKEHIAIHNSDKLFACTLCPYKGTTKSNLKKHIVLHNDEKAFACTLCPYKATTKSILKRHIASHNDKSSRVYSLSVQNEGKMDSEATHCPS